MRIEELYECFLQCTSVSTDTRKIEENSLFFALKGDNFDANTFAEEALKKGAAFVVIDNKNYFTDKDKMILVNNSLETLQELAKFHRNELGLPIIALTGSNGKTTTKELINVVLSKKYNTVATIGNLNNHIGVPLTLLSLKEDTDIGIVEMGANHQKEIEFLCNLAQPDFGYITNFGKAHLEGFGGVEGVIKGKSEMYTFLNENNKTFFINLDDPIQKERANSKLKYAFSSSNLDANVVFSEIEANPFVSVKVNEIKIQSNLIGVYNATNICAAITIGTYFNVSENEIKEAIENYIPTNNRSQLIEKGTAKIILDAYNANPSSMQAAIENFKQLEPKNKIAVLGDMFELGLESEQEHLKIVETLETCNFKTYLIGKAFYTCKQNSSKIIFFETLTDFNANFDKNEFTNATILIKGSRGMALEKVLELLWKHLNEKTQSKSGLYLLF